MNAPPHNEQPPTRIGEHTFAGPDEDEADDQATGNINDECSVGKYGTQPADQQPADQISGIGSKYGSQGY